MDKASTCHTGRRKNLNEEGEVANIIVLADGAEG
jgi:hypothetical protein